MITRNDQGLFVLQSYIDAKPEELAIVVNGCGSANAKFDFVPDTIWGVKIAPACSIHDWAYDQGKTWSDKTEADFCFLINMLILVTRKKRTFRLMAYYRAMTYWAAVHEKGDKAFWKNKTRPSEQRKESRPPKIKRNFKI